MYYKPSQFTNLYKLLQERPKMQTSQCCTYAKIITIRFYSFPSEHFVLAITVMKSVGDFANPTASVFQFIPFNILSCVM